MADVLRSIGRHLRRYPAWYPLVAVWAVVMALLPVLHDNAGAPARSHRQAAALRPAGDAVAVAAAVDAVVDGCTSAAASIPTPADGIESPAASGPTTAKPPAPADDPALVHLPQLPAVPIPTLPASLDPVLQLGSPLASTGCGVLGITRLGILTLAPAAPQLPLEDANGYLVPAYTACAVLPLPATTTVCTIDNQVAAQEPAQLVGIYTLPPVVGLTLDQIAAVEALLAPLAAPNLSTPLAATLTCDVHANS